MIHRDRWSVILRRQFQSMKHLLLGYCLVGLLLLTTSCSQTAAPPPVVPLKQISLDASTKLVAGQTVYVPIYSHIYMWDQNRRMDLTATLSIRNTDQSNPIIVVAVDYYDMNGKLVRRYLKQPVELNALAATDFVVNQEDTAGGSGASFIVQWAAQRQVSVPVIESIMINAGGNQGVSFISPGRVLKTLQLGKATKENNINAQ